MFILCNLCFQAFAVEMQLQFNIQLKSNFQQDLEQNNALLVIFKSDLCQAFPFDKDDKKQMLIRV